MSFREVKWLEQCPKEDVLKTFLFYSNRLNTSQNLVINLLVAIHTCLLPLNRKNIDLEVSREKEESVTTVYRKPFLVASNERFLPAVY